MKIKIGLLLLMVLRFLKKEGEQKKNAATHKKEGMAWVSPGMNKLYLKLKIQTEVGYNQQNYIFSALALVFDKNKVHINEIQNFSQGTRRYKNVKFAIVC